MNEEKSLNRRIARALGYTVRYDKDRGYCLMMPNGTEYGATGASRSAALEAYYASGDEVAAWQQVPDYCNDLNAVADALPDDVDLHIYSSPGRCTGHITKGMVVKPETEWIGRGATRHEAAARALLAYAEAQKAAP